MIDTNMYKEGLETTHHFLLHPLSAIVLRNLVIRCLGHPRIAAILLMSQLMAWEGGFGREVKTMKTQNH